MELSPQELAQLQELEQSLLNSDVRHSQDRLTELLADEFIEFGSSGHIYDKQQTIRSLAQSAGDVEISLSQFSARRLAKNLALVTYRSKKQQSADSPVYAFHSSIWRQTRNGWRILFHQGTPTDGEDVH
jgi:hypothetical protein